MDSVTRELEVRPIKKDNVFLMFFGCILKIVLPVVTGLFLTYATFRYAIPSLQFVRFTLTITNPDYGSQLPEGALCYVTRDIPILSDSLRYGMRILYHDSVGMKVGTVISVREDKKVDLHDPRGNAVTIDQSQYLGVISCTIPYIGKYFSEYEIN